MLKGIVLEYVVKVIRKKVKHVYIRIKPPNVVEVSAGKGVSLKEIRQMIEGHERWIQKKLKQMEEPVVDSLGGKVAVYLGERYVIELRKERNVRAQLIEDRFILGEGALDVQVSDMNNWYASEFCRVLQEYILSQVWERAAGFGIKPSQVVVKQMKSRFGSYSARTDRICLNLVLARYPVNVVKSVLYHEVCHKKVMNHQEKFYRLLERMEPNYDRYNRILKKDSACRKELWFLDEEYNGSP